MLAAVNAVLLLIVLLAVALTRLIDAGGGAGEGGGGGGSGGAYPVAVAAVHALLVRAGGDALRLRSFGAGDPWGREPSRLALGGGGGGGEPPLSSPEMLPARLLPGRHLRSSGEGRREAGRSSRPHPHLLLTPPPHPQTC